MGREPKQKHSKKKDKVEEDDDKVVNPVGFLTRLGITHKQFAIFLRERHKAYKDLKEEISKRQFMVKDLCLWKILLFLHRFELMGMHRHPEHRMDFMDWAPAKLFEQFFGSNGPQTLEELEETPLKDPETRYKEWKEQHEDDPPSNLPPFDVIDQGKEYDIFNVVSDPAWVAKINAKDPPLPYWLEIRKGRKAWLKKYSPAFPHGSKYRVYYNTPDGQLERIPAWATYVQPDVDGKQAYAIHWEPPPERAYKWKHTAPKVPKSLRIYKCHVGISGSEPKIASFSDFTERVTNFFAVSSRYGMGLLVFLEIVHSYAAADEMVGLSLFDGSNDCYFHTGIWTANSGHVAQNVSSLGRKTTSFHYEEQHSSLVAYEVVFSYNLGGSVFYLHSSEELYLHDVSDVVEWNVAAEVSRVNVPEVYEFMRVWDGSECSRQCANNCSCTAYSYVDGIGCLLWWGEIVDLQRLEFAGKDLYQANMGKGSKRKWMQKENDKATAVAEALRASRAYKRRKEEEAKTEYFEEKRNMEDLWKAVFPVGTEWNQLDDVYKYNWDFTNLEEALEEGGVLHGKKVYIFGCTEPQLVTYQEDTKIINVPVIVAVVSPIPPSDKIGITSVQRESEEIVPMKQMKMDWFPYIPMEKRDTEVAKSQSQIFVLKCTQRRSALRHMKIERLKKFEYCLPYFHNPLGDVEFTTEVTILFPAEDDKPVLCEFDFLFDKVEEFTEDMIRGGDLCEDQKDAFMEFVSEKVREGKRAIRDAIDAKRDAREGLTEEIKTAYRNMRFYKFYPRKTDDSPDVSSVKAHVINRYYRRAHHVL
ncbi:Protein HEAT INTOLERANT 4 [Linum grandiflorum]